MQQIRRAWWSSVVMFLVHGLVVSTWVSRIPAVQAKLGLNNGTAASALAIVSRPLRVGSEARPYAPL